MKISKQKRHGFTLVEIMIVVAIIGLLAVMAIPSLTKARVNAKVSSFLNHLRISTGAFEMYALELGSYPPDVNPGIMPAGMSDFLFKMDWTGPTPLGGQWDWDNSSVGITAGVTAIGPGLDLGAMQVVDDRLDDGNLNSGRFRRTGAGGYTFVMID